MTSDSLRGGEFEARPARAAASATRFGSIVLARHGEPKLSRKLRLTAAQYREWWARYEEGGLLEGQTPPLHIADAAREAELIFASTRVRSIETARAVAGGKTFSSDEIFIEAPLPPPAFPGLIKLSPRAWGVLARFWWWFLGHHDGQETKAQAKQRAAQAAARLHEKAAEGHDVLVVAHGFFNTMVGLELRRIGWRCVHDQGFRYWSTRKFERG